MHADQIIWISDCCGSTELGEKNHRFGISSPEEFDDVCLECHRVCDPIPLSCEFCSNFISGEMNVGTCAHFGMLKHRTHGIDSKGNPCEHFDYRFE